VAARRDGGDPAALVRHSPLTSLSRLIAGKVLRASTNPLSGNKVMAILRGFASLYELPMQLAVLLALALAIVKRDRKWLLTAAVAVTWLLVDVLLALHGWGIAPRYMFEPASLLIVLAGAAVGRLLARDISRSFVLRFMGGVAVLALVVSMATPARLRARLFHNGIALGQRWARQIHRLHEVIARDGGRARVLACGQAVTTVPYQSILAWELDENVADVGWAPQA
jgi:hypothetical protein